MNIFVFISMVSKSEMRNICMYMQHTLLKIHVTSRPVVVRLKQHRAMPGRASFSALTGIGQFETGFWNAPGAFQTSYKK